LPRLGFVTDLVEATDVGAVESAIRPNTRLLLVEVVSNPLLRIPDIAALGAQIVCPSITKMLAGHSDVTLGAVCGSRELTTPIRDAIVTWGLNGSPFDCWLAARCQKRV